MLEARCACDSPSPALKDTLSQNTMRMSQFCWAGAGGIFIRVHRPGLKLVVVSLSVETLLKVKVEEWLNPSHSDQFQFSCLMECPPCGVFHFLTFCTRTCLFSPNKYFCFNFVEIQKPYFTEPRNLIKIFPFLKKKYILAFIFLRSSA